MNRIILGVGTPPVFKISKPGFDVTTADDDDMIMSITNKPAQIIAAGQVSCTKDVPLVVYWPYTLSSVPIVDFQASYTSDQILLPFHHTSSSYCNIVAEITTSQMTITVGGIDHIVNYIAIARSY